LLFHFPGRQHARGESEQAGLVPVFEVGSPTPFAVYKLGDALITSDSIGGSTTGVQENLT
jgi:hypothetical protein